MIYLLQNLGFVNFAAPAFAGVAGLN